MATPSGNYQFSFNGWLFGGLGQGVQITSITGLEDLPTLRVQDDTLGYLDGQLTGRDFLNGRTITMNLLILNDSAASFQTYLAQLKTYLAIQQTGTTPLLFQLPNRGVQFINARVRKRAITIDPNYTYGYATAAIEFFCPDPRIYDNATTTLTLTPNQNTGRTYNRVYNMLYTTSTGGTGNAASATNNGNTATWPIFTITGPCTNPTITSGGSGLSLGLTMSAADTLVINTQYRSVTLDGSPARNVLNNGSTWFAFAPGTTTLLFSAGGYSGTTQLVATFNNAYV